MRVLVADDNIVHQAILGRMIVRLGHEVDLASDGVEVVAAVQNTRYDLILLDVHMPSLDGVDAARVVRASGPGGQRPFIAALTVDAEAQERCRNVGMDLFLVKPIRIEEIRDLLDEVVRFHAARREGVTDGDFPADRDGAEPGAMARLDRDILERFRLMMGGDDPEFARELEADFIQDSMALCHAMRRTAGHQDRDALGRAAHSLKSNARMFGALRLSELARRMERLADDGTPHAWPELVERIELEIDAVHDALAGDGRTRGV